MPEQWWVCETCKKSSYFKQEILDCETEHTNKKNNATIVHLLWVDDLRDKMITKPGEFPKYITVKFGTSSKVDVIYEIKQIINRELPLRRLCDRCMSSSHETRYCEDI